MALTFSSVGCRNAAEQLTKTANNMDELLNVELTQIISKVKQAYQSEGAEEVYAAFEKMKARFPEFVKCVNDCANYLTNTVAPSYEKLENSVQNNL